MIVNPRSGLFLGPRILEDVRPVFSEAGIELDVHTTQRAGHGREIAATIDLSGVAGVCVIGGDGTFHEVLNGIMSRTDGVRPPLGLVPGGSGNSLMHDLAMTDPVAAARRICRLLPQPLDLLEVDADGIGRCYAFNLAAFGIMVTANVKAERLRLFGRRRYDVAALWDIMFHRHHRAVLRVEDGEPQEDDYAFIIGMNTMYMGLGMKIAPRADLADGKTDLLVVRHARRHQLIRMLGKVYKGEHIHAPQLEYRQVTSFSVSTQEPRLLNIDGENKGTTPLTVAVARHAVSLL